MRKLYLGLSLNVALMERAGCRLANPGSTLDRLPDCERSHGRAGRTWFQMDSLVQFSQKAITELRM